LNTCIYLLNLLQHLKRKNDRLYCVDCTLLPLLQIPREFIAKLNSLFDVTFYCAVTGKCVKIEGLDNQPRIVDDGFSIFKCIYEDKLYSLFVKECTFEISKGRQGAFSTLLNSCVLFLRIIDILFKMNLENEATFRNYLYTVLQYALPTCKVEREKYIVYKEVRVDLFVECNNYVVAFEIKSPSQVFRATPSKNIVSQINEIYEYLEKVYSVSKGKKIALIVLPTDGMSITFLYRFRQDKSKNIHVITQLNAHDLEQYCSKQRYKVYDFLSALVEGLIDTLYLDEKAVMKKLRQQDQFSNTLHY